MKMNLFDHIKLLHNQELYHDLKNLASMVLTLSEQSTDLFTMPQKYLSMVFYGDSLYQTEEYRKAEDTYRKALPLKKAINKTKSTSSSQDLVSEVDVKYKIHLCHCALNQYREALNVLESVTTKQRSAKINMALARLYQRTGMDRSAITCFKEVLRECPLALQAIQGLILLGVKGAEVITLVLTGLHHGINCDWLSTWIKGHSYMAAQEYPTAISTFKFMDSKSYLKDNVSLLCSLGEAHFKNGDYANSLLVFQRAHALDPCNLKGMDIYAYLLSRDKKCKELESLSNQMMSVTEHAPEPWITVGYFCMVTKKATRAVYFAQRLSSYMLILHEMRNIHVCDFRLNITRQSALQIAEAYTLDCRNIEALLLKGSALLELKKVPDAQIHFREALRLAPHRFEAHVGLIECYTSTHRTLKEAIGVASKAIKTLGHSARSLTLYASVLAKESSMAAKAKPYLDQAMKMDPTYLEPVYIMAEILSKEHQFQKGMELLRRQLYHHSTCRLHQMMGDFLTESNYQQEALDHYSIALGLDPTNSQAKEGIDRVEKLNDMALESSGYDVEVDDMEASDNDADFEGSDVESGWSETDFT